MVGCLLQSIIDWGNHMLYCLFCRLRIKH